MPPANPGDLWALLISLANGRVPFVVIGGHAVNFHGYVRTTEDIDIVFRRSPASETALLDVLQGIRACWISDEKDPHTGLERLVPVTAAYIRCTCLKCEPKGTRDV